MAYQRPRAWHKYYTITNPFSNEDALAVGVWFSCPDKNSYLSYEGCEIGGWVEIWVLMLPIYIYLITSAVMWVAMAVRICRRAHWSWRSAFIVIKYRTLTGV